MSKLDLHRRNVIVKNAHLNYYTRAVSDKDTEILGAPLDSREFPNFTARVGRLKVTERIIAYEKRRTSGQELIGVVDLELPPVHFETVGFWIEIPDRIKEAIQEGGLHFMGGIHALEHAAIAMFPLFALCDRDDIGGISTPQHEQVCRAAVFIYDGHPGGVGLSRHIFGRVEELLEKTRSLVEGCPCEEGCPSCIHSPKCGSGNKPLDKQACLHILERLLAPERVDLRFEHAVHAGAPTRPPGGARDVQESRPPASSASPVEPRVRPDRNEVPEVTRMHELAEPRRIVVFDLETQRLADEVGGWNNISLMRLSVGVAFTDEDGFLTFTEETVSDLIDLLKSADLVVGFNQMRFDYEVLSAYSAENLRALPNLDILADIRNVLGFRIKLDHLAEFTLGAKKSGDGLDAVRWFREGRMDFLEKYCRDDVKITRDLFRFGLENGYLLYQPKAGPTARIPVDWARFVR
ncbi:MAG: DUF1998 domain-containing protein [Deltaproteobacteria bacterium]